jgi:imidazolonepropionase-like amidohydrolase
VITHVGVVDVEGGRVLPDRAVVVAGARIAAVGRAADVRVPAGARVVDGAGKYLIPGLVDMHAHVTLFGRAALPLYLAHGVTGVRDMGAERFADARALRDSIAAGRPLGPRMRVASPVVESRGWLAFAKRTTERAGTPWTLYERFGPATPAEAARWVDSVAALGADHVKVRNWPAAEIGRALVARAHARGLAVVGHANEPFPRAGVATYEHAIWPPLRAGGARDSAARDALWRTLAASGAAYTPTLVTWPTRLERPDTLVARLDRDAVAGLRYVPARARAAWRDQLLAMAQEAPLDWRAAYRAARRDAAESRRAGVPLLAGTDAGAPLVVPGASLHDELALLVRDAGATPLDALRAATSTPARVTGQAHALGAVAPGRLADLVLLDADPLRDIRNTRAIAAVVANGRLLDRPALDRLLAEAAAGAGRGRP